MTQRENGNCAHTGKSGTPLQFGVVTTDVVVVVVIVVAVVVVLVAVDVVGHVPHVTGQSTDTLKPTTVHKSLMPASRQSSDSSTPLQVLDGSSVTPGTVVVVTVVVVTVLGCVGPVTIVVVVAVVDVVVGQKLHCPGHVSLYSGTTELPQNASLVQNV